MYDRPLPIPSSTATILPTIAEEGAYAASPPLDAGQGFHALHAELQHWTATWDALARAHGCGQAEQNPMGMAIQRWCGHLIQVTQEAVRLESEGDRAGAAVVISDFNAIFDGTRRIGSCPDMNGAAQFIEARTTLMQRLVHGEFSGHLRTLPALEAQALDKNIADLCYCADPAHGVRLLMEVERLLGMPPSAPATAASSPFSASPFNAPPAMRPTHPGPASPPRPGHH